MRGSAGAEVDDDTPLVCAAGDADVLGAADGALLDELEQPAAKQAAAATTRMRKRMIPPQNQYLTTTQSTRARADVESLGRERQSGPASSCLPVYTPPAVFTFATTSAGSVHDRKPAFRKCASIVVGPVHFVTEFHFSHASTVTPDNF